MDDFVPLLIVLATVKKSVDFWSYAADRDINAIGKQVLAWVAGVLVVALVANTPWAATLVFADVPLAGLNWAGLVFVGIGIGSGGSVAFNDLPAAFDNTRSSAVPPLIKPAARHRRAERDE